MSAPNLWLSYQKGRLRSSANINYRYDRGIAKESKTYNFTNEGRTVFNQDENYSFSHDVTGGLSLDYDLTNRSVLGAGIRVQGSYGRSDNLVKTTTTDRGIESHSELRQSRRSPMDKPLVSAIVYYTLYTDGKYSTFDVIAGYSSYSKEHNFVNDFSGTESRQDLSQNVESYAAMASYTHMFSPKMILKVGIDWSDSHRRQAQTLDGDHRRFKYHERQIHGYVQLSRAWSEALVTDLGLRVENTHTKGHQSQEASADKQDYTDLFPSLSMSWNLPFGGQNLSLSYTRHISRPDMNNLDPYKIWTSDNSYRQGNPDLKPSYSDNVSMYYMFLQNFIFGARYSYNYRLMMPYTINTPEGLSLSSVTNTGRTHQVSLDLSYNKGLLPWWRTSASASANYRNIKTSALAYGIHTSGWDCSLSWNNTFIISRAHQLVASLSQDLYSPSDKGTYKESWKYRIMASVQKTFTCGLEVSLSAMIPVTGFRNYEKFTLPEYSYEYRHNLTPYYAGLNISYSFGKKQVRGARDRINEIK